MVCQTIGRERDREKERKGERERESEREYFLGKNKDTELKQNMEK